MSTEDNKALVRRAIEEVWNQGNVAGHHHLPLDWREVP